MIGRQGWARFNLLTIVSGAFGVFRRDLNPAIVARIFPGMLIAFLLIQEVIGTEKVQTFDYDVIIEHVVCIFLQGVLAEPSAPQRIARKSTGIGKRKTP